MKRIKGLEEYVQWSVYRQALGLPKDQEEQYELLAQGSIISITSLCIQ